MKIIFQPIYNFLSGLFSKYISDNVAEFAAKKGMLYAFLTVTLPVIIKNICVWLVETVKGILDGLNLTYPDSIILHATGLLGYVLSHLNMVTVFTIILAAMAIRLIMNFIPFVK